MIETFFLCRPCRRQGRPPAHRRQPGAQRRPRPENTGEEAKTRRSADKLPVTKSPRKNRGHQPNQLTARRGTTAQRGAGKPTSHHQQTEHTKPTAQRNQRGQTQNPETPHKERPNQPRGREWPKSRNPNQRSSGRKREKAPTQTGRNRARGTTPTPHQTGAEHG